MLAYWLAGIGTLALAFITFYVEVLRPRKNRPKFSVTFGDAEPYCRQTRVLVEKNIQGIVTKSANAYWIRLRVTNSGKSVAKRCVGRLVMVLDKSGKELADYDPVALHWVGTDPNEVPLRPVDLNCGEYEYLDVIRRQDDQPDKAFICRDVVARGIPNWLPPAEYILRVTIYGDNVNPQTKTYRLTWDASNYLDIRLQEIPVVTRQRKREIWRAMRSVAFPIRVAFWILGLSIGVLALGYALRTDYPLQSILVIYVGYFGLGVSGVRCFAELFIRFRRWWRS